MQRTVNGSSPHYTIQHENLCVRWFKCQKINSCDCRCCPSIVPQIGLQWAVPGQSSNAKTFQPVSIESSNEDALGFLQLSSSDMVSWMIPILLSFQSLIVRCSLSMLSSLPISISAHGGPWQASGEASCVKAFAREDSGGRTEFPVTSWK